MKKLTIAIPTKLQIHANTMLSLLNAMPVSGYEIDIRLLPGKSNIDQARSILATRWYDSSNDDDLFLFIDSDQTFTVNDILGVINLNCDIATGTYSSLNNYPCCRPKDYQKFLTGESNDLYYGATGFMLIRKGIMKKIEEFIKHENMGHSRYYVSYDSTNIIPFFKQRLIISETIESETPTPEWLGEDYAFCWMVRKVGGTIKCYVSPTIGHEVPKLVYFYPENYKSKEWDTKSIVYYTGKSLLKWSPESIETEGLGGSETAVIYLSKYWIKLGYNVTVYGNVDEGNYEGVEYINHSKFHLNDKFNILILWRAFGMAVLPQVKSKQLLIDLHDIPSPTYNIIFEYWNKIDKIFVKSNFHKNIFPEQTRDKIISIQNGVSESYFNMNVDNIKKQRYKLIYTSSYDRGLYEMLKFGFPLIKEKVPEAELHIYYGMELLPNDFKDKIVPLLKTNSVFEHGRVNHKKILEKKLESSIHYYIGCLSETDCISVKESVLAECIPVVSENNVFSDNDRDYCIKIKGDPLAEQTHTDAAKNIIKLLTDDEYYKKSLEMVRGNKHIIETWETVSNKWEKYFIDYKTVQ